MGILRRDRGPSVVQRITRFFCRCLLAGAGDGAISRKVRGTGTMAGREHDEIDIRNDEEGQGAIVSFPFDADVAQRFREAFPRAR